jgi:transposase, IS30 family
MGSKYSQLTRDQRFHIQFLLARGVSQRQVALTVGVHPSTITRELLRAGSGGQHERTYFADRGQLAHDKGRVSNGLARRKLGAAFDSALADSVRQRLEQQWSPEQIAGRMRNDRKGSSPAKPSVSPQTIYATIHAQPRGQLRAELVKLLRRSQAGRLPRPRGSVRNPNIQDAVPICERPADVHTRIVPGHWEGDLIKGARNASAVGTLVERTSRLVMLVPMPAVLTSNDVTKAFAKRLRRLPPALRKTLTYDRGTEMASHKQLAAKLKIDIFFCDPNRPNQRGTNENTNGLIRQYLPKGTDLSIVTLERLKQIEDALNNRPRKVLGFKTPNEVFSAFLAATLTSVALQA